MRALAALSMLFVAVAASADEPPTAIVAESLFGRVNPLGLEDALYAGVQQRLYRAGHAALRDNFISSVAVIRASPSAVKVGPLVELQPLSLLHIRFAAEMTRWFGVFTSFQSFGSALDDDSDSTLYKLADQHRNYAATTIHVGIAPRLQLQLGPIVLRDELSVDWYTATLRPGDRVFYETTADALVEPGGLTLTNIADLLWSWSRRRVYLGLEYVLIHPFYSDGAYRAGEPHLNLNSSQRLLALAAWSFYHRGAGALRQITAVAQIGWYLQHRWRTGQDVAAGIPFLLGGLVLSMQWPH